ncbi:DUF3888 domain-containing protein [Clostridium sp. ZS2-4]|uniref:DUF3888 domain-containing protein n=1 Tax=Clostridium sp. ZS2-4 TaxID=2987703 RepID=UPI00227C57EE|nr:DUF3888 domain-containing protein [Clostridium sp. ZS2-4]MCY6356249.1 DUF3888 domain-containing protein [Clostridium sp. ZS2-4]
MKKFIIVLCFLVGFTCFFCPFDSFALNIKQPSTTELSKLPENSKEAIYQDVIISLLIPYMQKEINNYYKEYLTELPIIFPYSVDIISVKRESGSGYLIQLELVVHPFVGPINTVGDDRIIIETGAFGSVKIKKFEHIRSYPLPWNWQHIIKKHIN